MDRLQEQGRGRATGNWMYLYGTIEKYVPDVLLAHPLKTRAIAEARIKTDTIDATTGERRRKGSFFLSIA